MTGINCAAVGAIILPNIGGWCGGYFTAKAVNTWYKTLILPSWRPPNWAFGPAWTILFSSMGFASYLVWKDGGGFSGKAALPLGLYGCQLALNWAWTPIFFGARSIIGGLVDIALLDVAVIATTVAFFKVNRTAGYLMLPYIAWLGLATALNYTIYQDNKGIESSKDQ